MEHGYEISIFIGQNYGKRAGKLAGTEIPKADFEKLIRHVETSLACVVIDAENDVVQGGTTTFKARGQWEGTQEKTTIVTTWTTEQSHDIVLARARETAAFIKFYAYQDCVAIQVKEHWIDLIF